MLNGFAPEMYYLTGMKPGLHSARVLCFGEVLWDVLPEKRLPGGAPMNVAYHLGKQGIPSIVMSAIGTDELGDELLEVMSRLGINTTLIQRSGQYPTSRVMATVLPGGHMSYEILEGVAWDHIAYASLLDTPAASVEAIVYGSLAARSSASRETLYRLLEEVPYRVMDVNLRPPFADRELVTELMHSAEVLKLNEEELDIISSWLYGPSAMEEQLQWLGERFSPDVILLTRGPQGAAWWQEGRVLYQPAVPVVIADTIGSGDAFLAASLAGILKGEEPADILKRACGLGSLVASRHGACPDYETEQVLAMIS